MRKTELLIPAGSLDVLKTAVVVRSRCSNIGGEAFGLRAKAKNFSNEDIREGIQFAHSRGVKVYITANILAHNRDLKGVEEYFHQLKEMEPDALIISDPGVFSIARRVLPQVDIHISTQANNTNYETYRFWWNLGAKRVVSAWELSSGRDPADPAADFLRKLEIESFIHGSNVYFLLGQVSSQQFSGGQRRQPGSHVLTPCRWKYSVVEETRPGEYMPVYENERGTFIFNSKDLCMIEHVPEMIEQALTALRLKAG